MNITLLNITYSANKILSSQVKTHSSMTIETSNKEIVATSSLYCGEQRFGSVLVQRDGQQKWAAKVFGFMSLGSGLKLQS